MSIHFYKRIADATRDRDYEYYSHYLKSWGRGPTAEKKAEEFPKAIVGLLMTHGRFEPDYLTQFSNVEVLNCNVACVANFAFTSHWPKLHKMVLALTDGNLNCPLAELPSATELETLQLYTSHETCIWPFLPNARGLDDFPSNILQLKKLKSLEIHGAKFSTIPNELKDLSLERLVLNGCPNLDIETLMTQLANNGESAICKSLKTLHLRGTAGKTLGAAIAHFHHLEDIDLKEASVENLPAVLGGLANLATIRTDETPFAKRTGLKKASFTAMFDRLRGYELSTVAKQQMFAAFAHNDAAMDQLSIETLLSIASGPDKKSATTVLQYLQSRCKRDVSLNDIPAQTSIGLLGGVTGYTKAEIKTLVTDLGYTFATKPEQADYVIVGSKSVKAIEPIVTKQPQWISLELFTDAANAGPNPVTADQPEMDKKIRTLLYSADIDNLKLAAKMMEAGIPDALLYDVVCMYLNCNKVSNWCESSRRQPLSKIYKKHVPATISAVIEPQLKKNAAEPKTIALIAVLLHDDIDATATMQAIARNHFFRDEFFRRFRRQSVDFFAAIALAGIPASLRYHALHCWCETLFDQDYKYDQAVVKAFWNHLAKHFGDRLVEQTYRPNCTINYTALGLAMQPEIDYQTWLNAFIKLESYNDDISIPADDYPQDILDYYKKVLGDSHIWEVEIDKQHAPKLWANEQACIKMQAFFNADNLSREEGNSRATIMPEFLQGYSSNR